MPGVTAILFIGDVVGRAGRRAVRELLPGLRDELEVSFVVANGENAAGGLGITPKEADELFRLGVDAITLGNHAYRHRDVYEYLDREPRIVRPANFPKGSPGRGHTVVESNGMRLGVINLSGQLYLEAVRSPFSEGDALVAELRDHVGQAIGPIAKPKSILFTEDLPKTRSGKIMRRLLRNVAEDQALGDTTTLADPGVVDGIKSRYLSTATDED